MRRFLIAAIALAFSAISMAALALQATDTMEAWKSASAKERLGLLERLLGKAARSEGAGILKCLNEASDVPGHAGLGIADLVKACRADRGSGQPV